MSRRRCAARSAMDRAGDIVRWARATMSDSAGRLLQCRQAACHRQDNLRRSQRHDVRRVHPCGGALRRHLAPRFRARGFRIGRRPLLQTRGRCRARHRLIRATSVRGLLTDQIHAASAAVWAHAATGQLPYSMLAAELLQFAVRTMWDEKAGGFRDRVEAADPVAPFELNCHAACVLNRLGLITGDAGVSARAGLLESLGRSLRARDLRGAIRACGNRECGPPSAGRARAQFC